MLLAPSAQHAQRQSIMASEWSAHPGSTIHRVRAGRFVLRPHKSVWARDQPATCCLLCLAGTGDSKARPWHFYLNPHCSVYMRAVTSISGSNATHQAQCPFKQAIKTCKGLRLLTIHHRLAIECGGMVCQEALTSNQEGKSL